MTSDNQRALRAAFVGGGFMAKVHSIASRSAGAELAGVVTSSMASAQRASSELAVGTPFATLSELLLAPDIDVVHVCTPNATHFAIVSQILAAGKHVVCEKPLATSPDDATALTAAARTARVVAAVPFVYRFYPMVREARALIRNGDLGRILTIQGTYTQDWLLSSEDYNWRVDRALGGPSRAFADIGSHLGDLLEFVLDDRISHLSAIVATAFTTRRGVQPITTEDIASVVFETERGAVGNLMISQVAPGRKNRLAFEIAGTDASLAFDQEDPERMWLGRRSHSQSLVRDESTLDPSAAPYSVLPPGHPQGYQDAFNCFVRDVYSAVRTGIAPDGLPTFTDGLRATRLTTAVHDAASRGLSVSLEEIMATEEEVQLR